MSEILNDMTDTTIKPVMPTDDDSGSPADKQLMVRCTQEEKDLWKKASDKNNETLASFVRRTLNESSLRTTTCPHPQHMVKFYPWSKPQFFCLACNTRIDMSEIGR